MQFEITLREKKINITVDSETVEGKSYTIEKSPQNEYFLRIDEKLFSIYDVDVRDDVLTFSSGGQHYNVPFRDEQALLLEKMGFKNSGKKSQGSLKAPMPGKIVKIVKAAGDAVAHGETVIILEAMKMENELKAPVAGTIESIFVKSGESVEKNTTLLEIK